MNFDHLILDRTLDACLTAAALLALHEQPDRVRFTFTHPDALEHPSIATLPAKSKVVFVGPLAWEDGLPRLQRELPPAALVTLLRTLDDAGHEVVGILDLHPKAWRAALIAAKGSSTPEHTPLVGHNLRIFPLRAAEGTDTPFVSAAEVLLAHRGAPLGLPDTALPEHAALLCRMAIASARNERWTRGIAGIFRQEAMLGDWAVAAMIRALATSPRPTHHGSLGENSHAIYMRAAMFHAGVLTEGHHAGPILVALAGNLVFDPGGLDDLTVMALRTAPIVAIGWQAAAGPCVRVAVSSHRIDLLALAKEKGVHSLGRPHAVDVAAGEAEMILAAALAAHEENEMAS